MLGREVAFMFVCGFEELSNGWVLPGKWGLSKKSVMMCERYISKGDVSLDIGVEGRTYGYGLHVHSSHNHGRE